MADNQPSDTDLTEEDFEELFTVSWRWLGGVFLVIFLTLSGLFYWFNSSMRANSNARVREAEVMIDKFDGSDTEAQELSPVTLELEEMRINTEQDREFIARALEYDSFPRKMNQRLKQRYLQQSFYAELPDDWRDRLPEELQQYRQEQEGQQIGTLRAFLSRMPRIVEENQRRLNRLEEIRKQLDLPEKFQPTIERYKRHRDRFRDRLDQLDTALDGVDTSSIFRTRKYPDDVFQGLLKLLDPLSMMGLQYRRFSGLTSRASSLVYAEQVLRDAERIDPMNPEVLYQLGIVYDRMGLGDVSNEHFLRGLRVSRGQSHPRRSQIVTRFEEALEEDTGSARAHYDVAFAYYETGRKPEALDHLLSVIEIDCALDPLDRVRETFESGDRRRAMAMVNRITARECEGRSMVQTLAKKRIEYILEGETPYYRLTYF